MARDISLELGMWVHDLGLAMHGEVIAWYGDWVICKTRDGEEFASQKNDLVIDTRTEGSAGGLEKIEVDGHEYKVHDLIGWQEDEQIYKIQKITSAWCLATDLEETERSLIATQWDEMYVPSQEQLEEIQTNSVSS